jgi:hypothetical protein
MNFMKRFQAIAAYLVVLALSGAVTLKSAEPGKVQGKALVRTVHGTATYSVGGVAMPLKANMELEAGTLITTGPDSYVYVNINGISSSVRVAADTTMAITTMNCIGSEREGDTETMLDVKAGSILGNVQKVSANSTYEIKTPHGVAGIRGTDFEITVTQEPDGKYLVTFTSVHGRVFVSAVVNGAIETRELHDGESWCPGAGDVVPTPLRLLDEYSRLIDEMIAFIQLTHVPSITVPIRPPFPYNNPPGQQPSSGSGSP